MQIQLSSPRASVKGGSPKTRFSSNIARPDDASSLGKLSTKWKKEGEIKAAAEVARPGDEGDDDNFTSQALARVFTTPSGETCISKKEEALEKIMSAEAYATFERTARHQLNRPTVNRTAIDPVAMGVDMNLLDQFYSDGTAVLEPDSDSDDEMIRTMDHRKFHCGPNEHPPASMTSSMMGVRFGYGFTMMSQNHVPQDRIFASRCGDMTLMGIINCHGCQAVGPTLAHFIAEELPNAFFKSPWLTQEKDPAYALSHAFDRVHRKAIQAVDCRLTGACCTVVLLDATSVYIAHVGDCRAVLAVRDPNVNAQKYHYIPIALTVDHKLSVSNEFDRIQEYGGEVRRCVNDNVHRLFFQDDYIPGLTLTRGIGHRMAHPIGVSHIPSIQVLQRSELDQSSFIVLGSGGIWHCMSERGIVNWVGNHFTDPGEAAESLGQECLRRWDDPSTRLKAYVKHGASDSFSSLILYPALDPYGAIAAEGGSKAELPRNFQLGPHTERVARREWSEVQRMNWKEDLAAILNGTYRRHE